MFQRLQQKWKVNGLQLLLILCTFAIGGSLTGFAGKKLMNVFAIEERWLWVIIYIIVITILWPFSVLLVSLFFGQYRFFTAYIRKIGRRVGIGLSHRQQADRQWPMSNMQWAMKRSKQHIDQERPHSPFTIHYSPLISPSLPPGQGPMPKKSLIISEILMLLKFRLLSAISPVPEF